jgi:hypothetical protein
VSELSVRERVHRSSGLLKLVGYNLYSCSLPAVLVSVPGYRRVNEYGFEKGQSLFFLEKTRCTRRPYPNLCIHTR